jgi:C-5 cytosine-specific DNA methylase
MVMNVWDFYSGVGGVSYGFRRAGFNPEFALDTDLAANRMYQDRFAVKPIRCDVFDFARMVYTKGISLGCDVAVFHPPGGSSNVLQHFRAIREITLKVECNVFVVLSAQEYHFKDTCLFIDQFLMMTSDYGVPWSGSAKNVHVAIGSSASPETRALIRTIYRRPERTHDIPERCRTNTMPGVKPLEPYVEPREGPTGLPEVMLQRLGHPALWHQVPPKMCATQYTRLHHSALSPLLSEAVARSVSNVFSMPRSLP